MQIRLHERHLEAHGWGDSVCRHGASLRSKGQVTYRGEILLSDIDAWWPLVRFSPVQLELFTEGNSIYIRLGLTPSFSWNREERYHAETLTRTLRTEFLALNDRLRKEKAGLRSIVAVVRNPSQRFAVQRTLELIGGLGVIVNPGSQVLLKPDMSSIIVTGLGVIETVVDKVKKAGGIPIIAESLPERRGIYTSTRRVFQDVGLVEYADKLNVIFVNLDEDEAVEVEVPDGVALKKAAVARTVLDCNVRISLPVLKLDRDTGVSLSLRNMVGCVPERFRKELVCGSPHQATADLNTVLKPHLSIIDGTLLVDPEHEHYERKNTIIASFDPVAADAVGSKILKVKPEEVEHINLSWQHDLGNIDSSKYEVWRES